MANYYASARSNYFEVRDRKEFEKTMASIPGVKIQDGPEGQIGLFCTGDGDSGWPNIRIPEGEEGVDWEDYEEIDIFQEVAQHLVPGSIAVFQEAGAEKLRYITGYSLAVNHLGKTCIVNIDDIYIKARKKFGKDATITLAQY